MSVRVERSQPVDPNYRGQEVLLPVQSPRQFSVTNNNEPTHLIPVSLQAGENPGIPNLEREQAVEEWENAPAYFIDYSGGAYRNSERGIFYKYPPGRRLEIEYKGKREQVMDSAEKDWGEATVNELAKEIYDLKRKPRFLVRGFGLGIDSTFIVQKMMAVGGGTLHIIELNKDVIQSAKNWKQNQEKALTNQAGVLKFSKPNVQIEILEGDAVKVTDQLVKGKKSYDRILTDTYPITEEEQGVNDLLDLGNLNKLLTRDGLMSFYSYYPGSRGGVYGKQKDLIYQHGFEYSVGRAPTSPPPDYRYLFDPQTREPVRELPVVICKKRRDKF